MNARANCLPCHGQFVAAHRTLCVRSAGDLTRLLWTFYRYDSVHFVSSTLSTEEELSWERRLTDSYTECGCDAGAVAVVVALCAVLAWGLANPHAHNRTALGWAVLVCFCAALAGKLIGIAVARFQLWRDIRRVGGRL